MGKFSPIVKLRVFFYHDHMLSQCTFKFLIAPDGQLFWFEKNIIKYFAKYLPHCIYKPKSISLQTSHLGISETVGMLDKNLLTCEEFFSLDVHVIRQLDKVWNLNTFHLEEFCFEIDIIRYLQGATAFVQEDDYLDVQVLFFSDDELYCDCPLYCTLHKLPDILSVYVKVLRLYSPTYFMTHLSLQEMCQQTLYYTTFNLTSKLPKKLKKAVEFMKYRVSVQLIFLTKEDYDDVCNVCPGYDFYPEYDLY